MLKGAAGELSELICEKEALLTEFTLSWGRLNP